MIRALVLALCLGALGVSSPVAQRPQTPPPPPPGVPPQPVGRTPPPTSEPTPSQQPPPRTTSPTSAPAEPARPVIQDPPPAQSQSPALPVMPMGPQEPVPTEEVLGLPIYPGARFIRSFDAGMGQRYYLFGATASFAELVAYYRSQLRTRGDQVYDEPPVHMFEVGRFREQTMAFPPGVTVKDYTWGGSKGYLVPIPGHVPERYPTIVQIVPTPLAQR